MKYFRVWPLGKKVRYYDRLEDIVNYFEKIELYGADIAIVINGEVVKNLNTDDVIDIFYE